MSGIEIKESSGKKLGVKTESIHHFQPPYINSWVRLALYVGIILFSGCLYSGWNGIEGLLYKSGSFEELCGQESISYAFTVGNVEYVDCARRREAIDGLFILAYTSQLIGSLFTGLFLDYVGPKATFIVGQLTSFVCWVMISSIPTSPKVLRVCFTLMGLTAESVFMPLTTVSNYFPNNQSLILTVLGSARTLSGLVPICLSRLFGLEYFKKSELYRIGIAYAAIFVFGSLTLGSIIIQKKFYLKGCENQAKQDAETMTTDGRETLEEGSERSVWRETLEKIKRIHSHPRFIEYLILVSVTSLFITALQFILRSHRELLVSDSGTGRSAAEIFKYVSILSFVAGPFLGYLMDKHGSAIVMVMIQFFCVLYLIFAISDNYVMKVLACLFFVLPGALSRSETYCYIRQRYPKRHFGVLSGLTLLPAGLFSLINIPLYRFGAHKLASLRDDYFVPVAMIQMVAMILSVFMSVALVLISKPPQHREQSLEYLDSTIYY